ncbi:hypothetical protein [Halocatena pleomorpha]|nr:hypothetical protein [Halocatena pleomorpha]
MDEFDPVPPQKAIDDVRQRWRSLGVSLGPSPERPQYADAFP